jgi:hypothetical protein
MPDSAECASDISSGDCFAERTIWSRHDWSDHPRQRHSGNWGAEHEHHEQCSNTKKVCFDFREHATFVVRAWLCGVGGSNGFLRMTREWKAGEKNVKKNYDVFSHEKIWGTCDCSSIPITVFRYMLKKYERKTLKKLHLFFSSFYTFYPRHISSS